MVSIRAKLSDGIYEFSLITPSGNGPRIRISGTTYEIEAVATGAAGATSVRFDHPTAGILALKGTRISLEYTELFSNTFTVTDAFTWEEVDLSAYGVPAGCVAEIRIQYPGVYSNGNLEGIAGIRKTGSSLGRMFSIQPYISGFNTVTLLVQVDSNCKIEIYSNYLTGLTTVPKSLFRVIGYFTNATYTETMITLQTTVNVWDTDPLFIDHGIPKGSVIEVIMGCVSNDYNRDIGLRQTGAVGRTYHIGRGSYGLGGRWVRVFDTTSPTNGEIDTYVSTDDSYFTHYCVGYWESFVTYTLDGTEYAPLNASVWKDVNVGRSVGEICNVVMHNELTSGPRTVGVRADSGLLSRYHAIERARTSTYVCMWAACVDIVGAGVVELYTTHLTEGVITVDGYFN